MFVTYGRFHEKEKIVGITCRNDECLLNILIWFQFSEH